VRLMDHGLAIAEIGGVHEQVSVAQVWGWAWMAAAVLCLVQAWSNHDRVAFSVTVALFLLWALLYVVDWLGQDTPRSWLAAALYAVFGMWLTIIATWPESSELPRPPPRPSDAVVTADSAGRISSWPRAAERMFGRCAAAVIGEPLTILMPQRYVHAHLAGLDRIRAGGAPSMTGRALELVAVDAAGAEFPVELTLVVHASAAGPTFSAVIRDMRGEP
ncbi:PAS domain S-box protein, partial [Sphaerisporangium sp. NPDC049002]|uniref:PAS domain S-box protein n=1 Tax=Sphaerisporangium sp. NPDC049002 TaxID=3155392 RepID=UPI0033CC521D